MPVVDLLSGEGRGPLWGDATEYLNLTLLAWPEGQGAPEHVNDACYLFAHRRRGGLETTRAAPV